MSSGSGKHSAAQAAAGYLYQARLALSEALKYAYVDSSVEVSIERLDDVSFEKAGAPLDLLQSKHHLNKPASLTDGSVDLWRTIGIWAGQTLHDPSVPGRIRFALITTGLAPDDSAAALLRPNKDADRSTAIAAAHEKLVTAARASKNESLKSSTAAFLKLTPALQVELLAAIQVLDGYPLIADLEAVIEKQIAMVAPRGKASLAREQLEGWWWPSVCAMLQSDVPGAISVAAIEQKLDDIRESLKRDNLPLDAADVEPSTADLQALEDMRFVRQLRGIGVGARRLEYAKLDYYRAFTQRSLWTRNSLILDDELHHFERTLVEEWEPRFGQMCDELPPACGESDVQKAAQDLYGWVEAEARFPLRNITNRFLNVGSYHILAETMRVGWHRDYQVMFANELENA